MARRFLIAPDKFKGSLTAREAAEAMAEGVRRALPDADCDVCPIADGGEGFMESLAAAPRAEWIECPAVDALGRPIRSCYTLADTREGLTAVMEMAETAGMWRLAPGERNPLEATTRGVGMQISHAVREHQVERVILGLGGSATNDGGAGMAAALGVSFADRDEREVPPVPARMPDVAWISMDGRMPLPEIIAACDVENPLLGPMGATAVFSRQKGATAEDQVRLEEALARLVELSDGAETALVPGAGAAGGLGFGLMRFAGARLVSGFDLIAGILDLRGRVARADHVLTGEGSLDHQSLAGKGPVALARMARAAGVPVTGFCGAADAAARDSGLFQEIHALADTGLPLDELIARASPLLTEAVSRAALAWRE